MENRYEQKTKNKTDRSKQLGIIGTSNSSIKAAAKKAYLFVSRLNKDTSSQDLVTLLKIDFPESKPKWFRPNIIETISHLRSPEGDFNAFCDKLLSILESVYVPDSSLILGGDFNCDPTRDGYNYEKLKNITIGFGLKNNVCSPTRGQYILNHLYTNIDLENIMTEMVPDGMSDHDFVLSKFLRGYSNKNSNAVVRKRIFSDDKIQDFCKSL
ncbi:hypothetical protein WA026_012572 [Henosepilachna vigintioctopunctata]|uniref:Endonuclease/exonuclease/phosphatase domain-containing protein n=1 Tax=Henosepilachna vigintioctopunctata TaxID=420089 RepID=A0AAW1U6F5_9CUCU